MFGERYFATRERLSEVLHGIAGLAAETGTELAPLAELEEGLGAPFLFVVCGEVNAGKSTLINGLFGHDLCKVNVLPETDRVLWYRYGNPARDVEAGPLLEERYRPLDFLRDFTPIDTPGTNSVVTGHLEITETFLPSADLILVVFPVTNPWGAATWDFVSRIPAGALERVAFIIQQSDQRGANDIEVILGHVADLSRKRIGHAPPIFAVSGKLAIEAKRANPINTGLLKSSGYPELESFISTNICHSPARRAILDGWRALAADALRTVEDHIEEQTRGINLQNRFMEDVEREIDGIRERFVNRLPRHLADVAQVFETEGVWVTQVLRKRLRAIPSFWRLFVGDRTGPQMEAIFIGRLQAAVEAVAEKDGVEVADACHSHWEDLGERVESAMGSTLNVVEPIDETLASAKERFVTRLGHAARDGVGNLKVRNRLDKEIRRRNLALKSFMVMTLLLTSAGAVCGALGVPWAPAILCGLAAVFFSGGVLAAWVTRKSISRDFQERLLDTCGEFAATLHTDYEEALRIVFRDYSFSLDSVRTRLAREKLAMEPRLRRWQELFLTLKAIEQEL